VSRIGAVGWVAAFVMLVALANFLIEDPPAPRERPQKSGAEGSALVVRVIDGDTILVRTPAGRNERVRYIGVDTPETVKPDAPVQCYGHEASNFNRHLVSGRTVRLVQDREARDRFGRVLAYVHVDGRFVNAELLKGGFARTIEIAPNTSKAAWFAQLQRVAMRTNKGLWKACRR
jgi:micrococcal nuclease